MPPRKKSEMASVGASVVDSDAPASIVALPDEMLVQIFSWTDSVTQKRAERVCRRWKSLLRDTPALRKYVVLDISCLATHLQMNVGEKDTLGRRFSRTLVALLGGNTQAQTLLITGESDVSKPWLIDQIMDTTHPGLSLFLPDLSEALRGSGRRRVFVSIVILDKLAVPAYDMQHFIRAQHAGRNPVRHVEFRDIAVQHLNQASLIHQPSSIAKYRVGAKYQPMARGLVRFITSGQLVTATAGEDPLIRWMTILSAQDKPLTDVEEEAYQNKITAASESPFSGHSVWFCKWYLGQDNPYWNMEGWKIEIVPTPFVKRLIVSDGKWKW